MRSCSQHTKTWCANKGIGEGERTPSEHAPPAVVFPQEIQSQRDREIMVGEYNATVTELRDRLVGVAQIPGGVSKLMDREVQCTPAHPVIFEPSPNL